MFRGCIRSDSVVSWLNCGPEVVGGKSLSRALVASSVQDSSLAALTKLLGSYLEGGAAIDFVLHDTMAVRACLSALHLAFQHSTEALAISYANVIMARRDLFFSLLRCRQRFAPLVSSSSDFGPALRSFIKTQAYIQRDVALCFLSLCCLSRISRRNWEVSAVLRRAVVRVLVNGSVLFTLLVRDSGCHRISHQGQWISQDWPGTVDLTGLAGDGSASCVSVSTGLCTPTRPQRVGVLIWTTCRRLFLFFRH